MAGLPPSDNSESCSQPLSFFSRRETKYELTVDAATRLRKAVSRHLPSYEFRSGFPNTFITTIYFDTDRLDFFRRAKVSYDDNLKIRVKEYYYRSPSDDNLVTFPYCFVEIKQRTDGLVLKRRIRVPKHLLSRLLVGGEDIWADLVEADPGLEFEDAREVYRELRCYLSVYAIRPRSIIHYRRAVYQRHEEELRITFDDELEVYAPVAGLYEAVDSLAKNVLGEVVRPIDKVILESKCQKGYPRWLTEALRNILPQRISKFTTSMNLLGSDGADAEGAFRDNGEATPGAPLPHPREVPTADSMDSRHQDETTGPEDPRASRFPGAFRRSQAGDQRRGGASDG